MSSYVTPARIQNPRTAATGAVPEILAPGSVAINWPDRKIYVGDAGGKPVRFSQWVDDWSPLLAYRKGDYAIQDGELYRATRDLPAGTPFSDEGDWVVVTGSGRAKMSEPFASSLLTGGVVTPSQGAYDIHVEPGTGVVISGDGMSQKLTEVAWGTRDLTLPATPVGWYVVWANNTGVVSAPSTTFLLKQERRGRIILAYVLVGNAGIVQVNPGQIPTGDTSEAVRDVYFADGGAYRASGLRAKADVDLTLDVSAGKAFALGGNWRTLMGNPNIIEYAARTAVPLQYASKDRLQGTPKSKLDPTKWDNSSGTLNTVPADNATIQFIAMDLTGKVFVQYGQALYASITAALEALPRSWDNYTQFITGPAHVLLGAAIMRGDTTVGANNTVVVAANKGDPFLQAAQGESEQYFLIDGSRALTGDMDAGGNEIDNAVIDGGTY